MFSCVWLHFKKIFGKYFLMFGKEEGQDKPKKNIINDRDLAINASRDCAVDRDLSRRRDRDQLRDLATARSREGEIAIDASRDRAINRDLGRRRDCDQLRDLTTARSREGEIAIDALQDHAVNRNLRSDRRIGAREIGTAWSSKSAGNRRTDWNVSSPLARARSLSLSLFFRKCFEVKMRGENHFRVKGENIGQPEVIFRKMSFSGKYHFP